MPLAPSLVTLGGIRVNLKAAPAAGFQIVRVRHAGGRAGPGATVLSVARMIGSPDGLLSAPMREARCRGLPARFRVAPCLK